MPAIDEIHASIQARLAELAPLVAEIPRLERALEVLDAAHAENAGAWAHAREAVAPYGLKADGTPYRRRPRTAEANAQMIATRRRRQQEREAQGRQVAALQTRLHVQTITTPERELEGREVAYTTQAPAMNGKAV